MASLVFLLNALSLFLLTGIAGSTYLHWRRSKEIAIQKAASLIGLCGILFAISGILNTSWFLNLLAPTLADFIIIESVMSILRSAIIFFLIYDITRNKRLYSIFFVYLAAALVAGTALVQFFLFIAGLSFLLLLIIFLEIIYIPNDYLKRAGYLGVAYAYSSLFLLILVYLGNDPAQMYWFIPNLFLLGSFTYLFLDIKAYGLPAAKKPYVHRKYLPVFFVFFKFMTFMITMSGFFLTSTIAIHEFGHAITAQAMGCASSKAVVYDIASAPHTELICPGVKSGWIITLAGLGFTLILGALFLFAEGLFTTIISYLIFGYAILVSYQDLKDLGMSDNMLLVLMLAALVLIIYGIVQLAMYYMNQKVTPQLHVSPEKEFNPGKESEQKPKQESI